MFSNPNAGLIISFIRNSFPYLGKEMKQRYKAYDLTKYDITLLNDILFEICILLSVDDLKKVKDNSDVSSLYNWYKQKLNANPKFFIEEYERVSNPGYDDEIKEISGLSWDDFNFK